MKYVFDGKEKRAVFGVYPEVSLSDARAKCLEARKLLGDGIDPGERKKTRNVRGSSRQRRLSRSSLTEWFENQKDGWSEGYADKIIKSLQIDVFPHIGDRPLSDINAPQMLVLVRRVESRGVRETSKRILQRSNAVFQYSIMTGRCTRNPAAEIDAETIGWRTAHGAGKSARNSQVNSGHCRLRRWKLSRGSRCSSWPLRSSGRRK